MKAWVYRSYGPPDALRLVETERPVPRAGEVLIRITAATVNRTDCATIRAVPFFARLATGMTGPRKKIPGTEFAGVIESTGEGVSSLEPGDGVFGFDDQGTQSQAQYAAVKEVRTLIIPQGLSFEQAAASFEGAHYAYNFINKVALTGGEEILVNGATGAIGSAAVQLLKHFGARVTAVCDGKHADLVESLGASRIIDYTRSDFTRDDHRYSCVFDTVGKSSFFKCRRLLLPGGVYISSDLGYLSQNIFLPLITPLIQPVLGGKKTIFPMPKDIRGSMQLIRQLIEQGKFRAVVDRTYPLERIIDAYRYVETGQKIGNVVITVGH